MGTSASAAVLLKLIQSQGVQNLLYGIAPSSLSKAEITSFQFAYNTFFAKIFKTQDNSVIMSCQYYSGYLPFEMLYDLYRFIFLCRLVSTGCLDKNISLDNPDYRDYMKLRLKYNFNDNDSKTLIKYKVWNYFEKCFNNICDSNTFIN